MFKIGVHCGFRRICSINDFIFYNSFFLSRTRKFYMEFCTIVRDIQIGLFLIDLEKPKSITISTFDFDLTLFMTELYNADIDYDIWYWYMNDFNGQKIDLCSFTIPNNVKLHQLERNHAKFWYITTRNQVRFILTSANVTYGMMHNCLQSIVSVTTDLSKVGKDPNLDRFFSIYNINLDCNIIKLLKNRLIYNIPFEWNGIERWLSCQSDLLVDCNNATISYLPMVNKKILIRSQIPTSASKIVTYYNLDKIIPSTSIISSDYKEMFHYKLYYTPMCVLVSSSNFSYNHKMNLELGILIYSSNE